MSICLIVRDVLREARGLCRRGEDGCDGRATSVEDVGDGGGGGNVAGNILAGDGDGIGGTCGGGGEGGEKGEGGGEGEGGGKRGRKEREGRRRQGKEKER